MLTTSMVHEIDRLLKEGQLSQRKIAARLGVSRGIVGSIASGRRGLHGVDAAQADDDSASAFHSVPIRCPRCGYRVFDPCQVCRARDHQRRQRQMASFHRPCEAVLGVRESAEGVFNADAVPQSQRPCEHARTRLPQRRPQDIFLNERLIGTAANH